MTSALLNINLMFNHNKDKNIIKLIYRHLKVRSKNVTLGNDSSFASPASATESDCHKSV